MRILHTADWHLGRVLHGVDLLDAQRDFLRELPRAARQLEIDCVLVAGDVFDRSNPRAEVLELYESALAELADAAEVVVISGNHDSAVRLGFTGGLLRPGIHVRTRPADVERPVILHDDHGQVVIHPIPYLDVDEARFFFGTAAGPVPRSHRAVVQAAVDRGLASSPEPSRRIAVAHAFVTGATVSESEQDIVVGGLGDVPAAVFAPFDFVALGHLHRRQSLPAGHGASGCYAGSPMCYSFSEATDRKGYALIDMGPDGSVTVTPVPIAQPRDMATITAPIEEVLAPAVAAVHRESWLQVTITDPERPPRMHERVKSVFPHALSIRHVPSGATTPEMGFADVESEMSPADTVAQFVAEVTGRACDAAETALIAGAARCAAQGEE